MDVVVINGSSVPRIILAFLKFNCFTIAKIRNGYVLVKEYTKVCQLDFSSVTLNTCNADTKSDLVT